MKNLYSLLHVLCFAFVAVCFSACQSSNTDISPSNQEQATFFLKDEQSNALSHVDPQIISLIHKKLLSEGRNKDASSLLKTYNKESGDLLPDVKLPSVSGAKRATSFTITQDGHSETIGWQYNIPKDAVVGTVGQGKRLEAFAIKTSPYTPGFRDSAYLQYRSYIEGYGWDPYRQGGQVTGTVGQGKRIEAIQIYGNPDYSSFVFYRVHVEGLGWMDYVDNNQVAGSFGRRVEAFQFTIVVYDQP